MRPRQLDDLPSEDISRIPGQDLAPPAVAAGLTRTLLSFTAAILLLASFSYRTEDRMTSGAELDDVLLLTRVIPLLLVAAICILATPVRQYYNLIREVLSPPFLLWVWYAAVATISGVSSNLTPLWAAWKCSEIFIVALWGAAMMVFMRRTRDSQVLEAAFGWLVAACLLVSVFGLTEVFRQGMTPKQVVSQNARLETELPHINSITLSMISLYAICGSLLLRTRTRLATRTILLIPVMVVFALARSRTGLLGLGVVALYAFVTSTIAPARKAAVTLIALAVVGVLMASPDVREWMRLDSWEDLMRGAGRIRTQDGRSSGWLESARLVRDEPVIGYGFIVVKRFMNANHASVDNFALQALISAGFLGARPMILYSLWVGARWLWRVSTPNPRYRFLAEMGMVSTCLALTKSMTTNGISTFDVSLIMFMMGAIALQIVRQPIESVEVATRRAVAASLAAPQPVPPPVPSR
ncbi:MAG TPA: hypothetical protein VIY86_03125 [Pirellulaceae bacterium]